jgi:hypothetical protein
VDTLTELVTAGITTSYQGIYDPQHAYQHGDMVLGSDNQTYVYLCKEAHQTDHVSGVKVPTPVVPDVTVPKVPTAPTANVGGGNTTTTIGGGGGGGGGVTTPVVVATGSSASGSTGGGPTGGPAGVLQGWTLLGIPAVWVRTAEAQGVFTGSSEVWSEVLFPPLNDKPDSDRAVLIAMADETAMRSSNLRLWAYVVDRSTGHIWYHDPVVSPHWFDLKGAVGVLPGESGTQLADGDQRPRASMVVDYTTQLSSLTGVAPGTVVLVYQNWQVWQKS